MEISKSTYRIKKIKQGDFTLTGNGEDSIWDTADVLDNFTAFWDEKKPSKTVFRALQDEESLYFCYTVYDGSIYIDRTANSKNEINNSDRVELFFRVNDQLNPYYCIEIDPLGRVMDFSAKPNKEFDFDWQWPENGLEVKTFIDDSKYVVEGKISIQSLKDLNLINDGKIDTGLFRAKYYKLENQNFEASWISWINPTTDVPNFHTPSSFGVVIL